MLVKNATGAGNTCCSFQKSIQLRVCRTKWINAQVPGFSCTHFYMQERNANLWVIYVQKWCLLSAGKNKTNKKKEQMNALSEVGIFYLWDVINTFVTLKHYLPYIYLTWKCISAGRFTLNIGNVHTVFIMWSFILDVQYSVSRKLDFFLFKSLAQ